jgi:hypothetical protein
MPRRHQAQFPSIGRELCHSSNEMRGCDGIGRQRLWRSWLAVRCRWPEAGGQITLCRTTYLRDLSRRCVDFEPGPGHLGGELNSYDRRGERSKPGYGCDQRLTLGIRCASATCPSRGSRALPATLLLAQSSSTWFAIRNSQLPVKLGTWPGPQRTVQPNYPLLHSFLGQNGQISGP